MTLPRFYCPLALSVGALVDLPDTAARHACRALRLRVGDALTIFNGAGGEYECHIQTVGRDRVTVEVLKWHELERESGLSITLVQALQSGDKMDTTVQKAVELGVSLVVPVATRRSVLKLEGERAIRRVEHWRAVAVSACEQCGRNRVPEIHGIIGLDRWLATPPERQILRLMLAPGAARTLNSLPPPNAAVDVELLIGAEGGLAPEEVALAEMAGFMPVRLGPRVLRTETAGMATVAAIQSLWGDFREGGTDHV